LSLTLEQAIELALKNNNDIDASRNSVQIAEFNLRGARGIYDPLIEGQSYYDSTSTPTASVIGGAVNGSVTQTRYFGSAGVSGFTPWAGGSYAARFDTAQSSTTNTNATLNPQYPSLFTLTYTQPIFRNRSFDNQRRLIEIAKKNLSLSDSQFRQRAIEVIAQVEQAYWNLAFALRFFQVQIDAVKQARTQLESNQRQVAKGILAPIEIVAATGQISTFEQNVYVAQEGVTRAENTLKALMLPDRAAAEWSRPITPVSPINLDPPQVGLEIAIAEALKGRPEIAQFDASEEVNEIDERYYRNQTKPQIDLVGSYTTQGLAGTVTRRRRGACTAESDRRVRHVAWQFDRAGLPDVSSRRADLSAVGEHCRQGESWSDARRRDAAREPACSSRADDRGRSSKCDPGFAFGGVTSCRGDRIACGGRAAL
jgi:HAE1 family hydrophobic/amphiphilic exporter-1